MTLRVPVTAASPVEWIRRAGGAVNALIKGQGDFETRTAAVEGRATSLESRATALETYTHASFTLTPGALPGTPVKGQTVYDVADDKVKTWDGALWQAHW